MRSEFQRINYSSVGLFWLVECMMQIWICMLCSVQSRDWFNSKHYCGMMCASRLGLGTLVLSFDLKVSMYSRMKFEIRYHSFRDNRK